MRAEVATTDHSSTVDADDGVDQVDRDLHALSGTDVAQPERKAPIWARVVEFVAAIITLAAMLGELFVTVGNVVGRWFGGVGIVSTLDVSHVMLGFIAFIGAAMAYQRGMSPTVGLVVQMLPARLQAAFIQAAHWLVLTFSIILGLSSISIADTLWHAQIVSLGISKVVEIIPLEIGAFCTVVFAIGKLVIAPRRDVVNGLGVAAAMFAGGFALTELIIGLDLSAVPTCVLIFVLFFALLLAGVPIVYALGLTAVAFVFLLPLGTANLPAVPEQMSNSAASSFLLLAIPFFVWAGLLMAHGEPSKRIAELVYSLTGRFRGGAMQAVIYSMFIFSGVSGSKIADMAMMGTMLQDTAKKQDYTAADTGGLVAAAACMGETIPPSIVMLLLASVTTLAVTSLFAAGIVPAFLLAVAMSVYVYIQARRRGGPTTKTTPRQVLRAVVRGLPPIAMPALLIWGIIGGVATPTEASAFAVLYALFLVLVVYRSLSLRRLWLITVETCAMSGMLLIMAAAAGAFAWSMAVSGASEAIVSGITSAGAHVWLFWVVSIGAMIILGCVLEGGPAFLIFGPLLVPAAGDAGINEVHFGICMLIAYGLGFFAPPFGAGIFMAATITRVPPMELARTHLPYWLLIFAGLVVFIAIPDITLALPRALGLPGV